MSTANMSITRGKDRLYVNQTAVEQNNNNKKSTILSNSETSKYAIPQKQFLICQHCFWCASYYAYGTAKIPLKLEMSDIVTAHCPGCNNKGRIESLPIS
jgi:hypothetical protein